MFTNLLARFLPLLLLVAPLQAQTVQTRPKAEMSAPFGLRWGDNTQRIQGLLDGAKARVTRKDTHQGRARWAVDGIKQEHLESAFFYFENGGLSEVELIYRNSGWGEQQYNAFMGRLRQTVASRFGPGEMLERSKAPFGEVEQTLVAYRWRQGDTIMELVYFGAQKGTENYRALSLHYRVFIPAY